MADNTETDKLREINRELSQRLRAENEKLREALKPFARAAAAADDAHFPDEGAVLRASLDWFERSDTSPQSYRVALLARDIRRARAALEGGSSGSDYTQPALLVTGAPSVTHKEGEG